MKSVNVGGQVVSESEVVIETACAIPQAVCMHLKSLSYRFIKRGQVGTAVDVFNDYEGGFLGDVKKRAARR